MRDSPRSNGEIKDGEEGARGARDRKQGQGRPQEGRLQYGGRRVRGPERLSVLAARAGGKAGEGERPQDRARARLHGLTQRPRLPYSEPAPWATSPCFGAPEGAASNLATENFGWILATLTVPILSFDAPSFAPVSGSTIASPTL